MGLASLYTVWNCLCTLVTFTRRFYVFLIFRHADKWLCIILVYFWKFFSYLLCSVDVFIHTMPLFYTRWRDVVSTLSCSDNEKKFRVMCGDWMLLQLLPNSSCIAVPERENVRHGVRISLTFFTYQLGSWGPVHCLSHSCSRTVWADAVNATNVLSIHIIVNYASCS